jgi:hypothetical protein
MAVARHQKGLFVSDDLDARRQAQAYGIPTTGTIGILLLNIQHKRIALAKGNELLTQLIKLGYRSQSPNSTTLSKYPEPNKATLLMPFSDWTRLLKKKTAATDWRHKASAAAIL